MKISNVKVPGGRRELRDVESLAKSIATVGLINPITVTPEGVLVAGLHRLRACESLGWEDIAATVLDSDALHVELAEIDENLIRNELTAQERGRQMARRKAIYEELHPETKHGGAPGAGRGRGSQRRKDETVSSFQDDTAEKTGASPRTVQHDVQIGSMPDAVHDAVEDTPLADNKRGLLDLARDVKGKDEDEAIEIAKRHVHVAQNSGNNEWYTPEDIIELARGVMGAIDLDPASSDEANKVVQAEEYFTADNDGLTQPWRGRVWMNPPYAQPLVAHFCHKLVEEIEAENVDEAIVLVNNATETAWFQEMAIATAVCFPRGRVKFYGPGGTKGAPLQGQALLYFGANADTFADAFGVLGMVWR